MISTPRKDPQLPSSYRPISLLSNLSQIAEAIILEMLRDIVGEAHLFLDEQFGFRQELSTDFELLRLTEEVRNALELRYSFIRLSMA